MSTGRGFPKPEISAREAAERWLLEAEVTEAEWEVDAKAVNILRASLAHGAGAPAGLIEALAKRCVSRRPALAKSALRALVELAESEGGSWGEAEAALSACLSALRGTKVAARVAEEALSAIANRIALETSAATAVRALASCTGASVRSTPPQPPAVKTGLKALIALCAGLPPSGSEAQQADEAAAATAACQLCDEVLKIRTLGPAYAEARTLRSTLQQHLVQRC